MFTATKPQIATYLLGVCLFSISFLVFLNASVSFVVTDIIGQHHDIGDAVGTLGFADELVAIFACPIWGVLSDRVGIQKVATIGYTLVGLALFVFVQAKNVYPGLLLARMLFSIGGAACTTMVTATLPAVTSLAPSNSSSATGGPRPSSLSVSSELTITPARVQYQQNVTSRPEESSPTRVAGVVGMFTGCGALVALLIFLPLPTRFKNYHLSDAQALKDTFYVVGAVAFAVAIACFAGLRQLQGEQHKAWSSIWLAKNDSIRESKHGLPYWKLLAHSIRAGSADYRIGLGYLGGFVARASSVGISLFIPLVVNTYFISSGRCKGNLHDPTAIKSQCREAYVLSSELTGVSQLVALIFAPIFGYFADKYRRFELSLLVAAVAGVAGYGGFSGLKSPLPSGEDGSAAVFVYVSLLGLSQIGAIVCSLGLLARGVTGLAEIDEGRIRHRVPSSANEAGEDANEGSNNERSHLLSGQPRNDVHDLNYIRGSIAGTYSLIGGAGILILTKLGGFLFDRSTPAAPFILMALFNVLLFVGVLGRALVHQWIDRTSS